MNKRRKNRELLRTLASQQLLITKTTEEAAAEAYKGPKTWTKPSKPKPEERKKNVYCEICNGSTLISANEARGCNYCSVVVHDLCLKGKYICKLAKDDWICPFCVEAFEYEKLALKKRNEKLNIKKREYDAQTLISKTWRKYKARWVYLFTMKLIRRLQRAVRLRFATKLFKQQRLEKLRPLGISITSSNICHFDKDKSSIKMSNNDKSNKDKIILECYKDIFLLITVVREEEERGQEKISQFWRMAVNCSHSEVSRENSNLISLRFDSYTMVGGVSGKDTLVFTLVQSSCKASDKDIFLGQTSVDMESHSLWFKGGQLNLKLVDMEFLVIDPSTNSVKEFIYPKRVSKKSKETTSWGAISIGVDVYYGMNADCGWIYASAPDEVARTVRKMPNAYSMSSPISIPRYDVEDLSLGAINEHKVARSSVIGQIFPKYSMKKAWACIANNYIYLYVKFGESPKIVLNIKKLSLKVGHVTGQKSYTFTFEANGLPEVSLSNFFAEEELKWKIMFISAKMCADDSMSQSSFNHETLCEKLKLYRKIGAKPKFIPKALTELPEHRKIKKASTTLSTSTKTKSNLKLTSSTSSSSELLKTDESSLLPTTTTTTTTTTSESLLIANIGSFEAEQLSMEELTKDDKKGSKAAFTINTLLSAVSNKNISKNILL